MGAVHQLILAHGAEGARARAGTKAERQAVDAAVALLAEEESRLGITHAGFAMTSLPHKRIEEALWRRDGHRTTLLVESGRHRNGELLGVPYGSIARLIPLHLQTEAVRTNSPEVELGRSMKSWMGRMSLSTGGRTYQLVAEQARRISGDGSSNVRSAGSTAVEGWPRTGKIATTTHSLSPLRLNPPHAPKALQSS